MENLPTEIAVEIATRLAESSDFALAEVGSLRATCKKMRQVCRMPEVGRCIAVFNCFDSSVDYFLYFS